MPHRMLQSDEAARYLHLSRADLDLLVRRNEIPFNRQGERVAFSKKELDSWASQRIMGLVDKHLTAYHRTTSSKALDLSARHTIMSDLIQPSFIATDLKSRTRASLLRDMVGLAERAGRVMNPADLLTSLREREELCSTALPGGIALLHPRHHDPYMFNESFVAFARTVQGIHFGAADGASTDLFFLICCQDDRIHLHVLARLCCMCHHTRLLDELRHDEDADALHAAILRAEDEAIKGL